MVAVLLVSNITQASLHVEAKPKSMQLCYVKIDKLKERIATDPETKVK